MIKDFWKLPDELGVDIWIGRVGSKVNPVDLPTREKHLPFPTRRRVHFKNLFALLMVTKQW